MRNALTRRPHKERAQPASRTKWGLLEKHKDYSLRAADYNLKKRKLAELQRKADARNPDEFHFGMVRRVEGRHGQGRKDGKGEERLGVEAVKLLKSQDVGYLRVVGGRARREMERVEEEVGLGEVLGGKKRKGEGGRVVFVDGEEKSLEGEEEQGGERNKKRRSVGGVGADDSEAVVYAQNEAPSPNDTDMLDPDENTNPNPNTITTTTPPAQTTRLSKKAAEKAKATLRDLQSERKRRKRIQEARASKLDALRKRRREILAAAEQLELQRAKMARTVGGVNKNGVKFKVRERRR